MSRNNYTDYLGEPKGMLQKPAIDGKKLELMEGWKVEGTGVEHSLKQLPALEGRIAFVRSFMNEGFDRCMLVGNGLQRMSVNGTKVSPLYEYKTGWNRLAAPFGAADVSELLKTGHNVIDFDIQGLQGISGLTIYLYKESQQIAGWKMKEIGLPTAERTWASLQSETLNPSMHQPRWYKTAFDWDTSHSEQDKLKISLNGLSKGVVWVNGFCIGRYWQIGPQEYYKIPTSILKEHNELLIFDEDGLSPDKVLLHPLKSTKGLYD